MHLPLSRSMRFPVLMALTSLFLSGCVVNPNFPVRSQVSPAVQQQPVPVAAPVSASPQTTTVTSVGPNPASPQTDASWNAAQLYVESVVTCKHSFTLQEMSKTLGPAGADFSMLAAAKKGGEIVLTPKKPFTILGLPVKAMRFDSTYGFLAVDVSTTSKAAVAALKARKFKMTPGVLDYKGSMTSVIPPKKNEEFPSQQIVVDTANKKVSVFCAPFYID